MDALRLFLAIDIPSSAREAITTLQNRFKTLGFKASWVRPENIHLTLKFLSNTPSAQVPDIKQAVARAANLSTGFTATLSGIGVFPNFKKPRVLWVGMNDPQNHLQALRELIERQMELIGFPREKRNFNPHLTLARIKQSRSGNRESFNRLKREIEAHPKFETEPFRADSVRLIQSQLTPEGSIYTVLEEFPLRGISPDPETVNR
ncbi:hypothetical protein UZ36_05065 [Candidatus Nitromaritima sp. SCGC AAA799-C22]|nr:hypothetical protein UZ36_05065 [Candidatus Nitromaritima sp. SCGC AAA799-C22]